MTSTFTAQVKNPQFRIVIPEDVRKAEGIELGDFVEISITKKSQKK
jgi:bifunctional DNA-binding transcriptional regulator/antitoxin component of YhaV-PrlF toxin-antitoxin module